MIHKILIVYLIIGIIWANTGVLLYKSWTPEKYNSFSRSVRVNVYIQRILMWPKDISILIVRFIKKLKELKDNGEI